MRWLVIALFLFLPLPGRGLAAQDDPRLAEAIRLAQEGMGDSARALAGRVLAETPPRSAIYPHVLYTIATVAADAEARRLYLQRVAIEFSRSAWAAPARLELAQLDYAAGDLDGAIRHVDRLLSDYRGSPLRATAALWGTRAAWEKQDFPLACHWANLGMGAAGEDVELRNQLEFQRQRCQARLAEGGAVRPPPTPPPPPPLPPPARPTGPARPAGPQWFVQVGAFRAPEEANRAVALLGDSRIPAVVVVEDGWRKVRAGPYASREEAARALPGIRGRVGGQPFLLRVP